MDRIKYSVEFYFGSERELRVIVRASWKGEEISLSHSGFLLFLYNHENELEEKDLDFSYRLAKRLKKIHISNVLYYSLADDADMGWFFYMAQDYGISLDWEYRDDARSIKYESSFELGFSLEDVKGRLVCQCKDRDGLLNNPLKWLVFHHDKKAICFSMGAIVVDVSESVLDFVGRFLDNFKLTYGNDEAVRFIQRIYKPFKDLFQWELKADLNRYMPKEDAPKAKLELVFDRDILTPSLSYVYGANEIAPDFEGDIVKDKHGKRHQRMIDLEQIYQQDLMQLFMEYDLPFMLESPGDIGKFLNDVVPKLKRRDWIIEEQTDEFVLLDEPVAFDFQMESSGTDWFSFEGQTNLNGENVAFLEIARLMVDNQGYLKTDKGFVKVEDGSRKNLEHLVKMGAFHSEAKFKGYDILPLLSSGANIKGRGKASKSLLDNFKSLEKFHEVNPGDGFTGELRDYQQYGVNWINFLYENNFGGILADDMGLGKTVQTIAFANQVSEEGPVLVVGPTNVIYNWKKEIEKFTTDKTVLIYTGPGRHQYAKDIGLYDFVITSFGIIKNDIDLLKLIGFKAIIVDEAQNMKNPKTQISIAMKQLEGGFRLVMSGTPVENHIQDLWNLFDFVMPDFLGSHKAFENDIGMNKDTLKVKIRPFVLRREKKEVLQSLPEKTEIIVKCPMSEAQEKLYKTVLLAAKQGIQSSTGKRDRLGILAAILRLRQVCIHPGLLKEFKGSAIESGKFEILKDKISELVDEGHKVVVFSQFTGMLDLFQDWIVSRSIYFERIDGAVSAKQRMSAVDRFQESEEAGVFVISLKAGGVGLNLTAADYVIHLDPWWNPAIESQATDRVHRMGQENKVIVYKLISEGSIEEKIQDLQEQKRQLLSEIIDIDSGEKALDFKEVVGLLE